MRIMLIFFMIISAAHSTNRASFSLGMGSRDNSDILTQSFDWSTMVFEKLIIDYFHIGFGGRLTHMDTSDGPVFTNQSFSEIKSIHSYALNAVVYLELNYKGFMGGFNIDLIGFSTGSVKENALARADYDLAQFNLLLGESSDKGSLSSELWLGYKYKSFLGRIGMAHQVIEIENPNDSLKYQRFFDTFFIGLGYVY